MIKGVGHVAIAVSNLKNSIDFYKNKMGFSVVRTFTRSDGAEVVDLSKTYDQIGELQLIYYPTDDRSQQGKPIQCGIEHIGLLVQDMDMTYNELKAKGITSFLKEPTAKKPNWPRVARLQDPDGVILELITFVKR
jgi:catechol 2,3-dioxygenase-like lactoylglutathione lyase family enzyme